MIHVSKGQNSGRAGRNRGAQPCLARKMCGQGVGLAWAGNGDTNEDLCGGSRIDRRARRRALRRGRARGHGDRARRAPGRDPEERAAAHSQRRHRASRAAPARDGRHPHGRPAGPRHPGRQGQPGRADHRRRARTVPRGHGAHPDAERDSVVVLPASRRALRGAMRARRRSWRPRHERHRSAADHRLRGVPRREHRLAWRGEAHRRRPLSAGRARRHDDAAHHAHRTGVHGGRAEGADPGQHPRRNLAETLGQSVVQSDQRAHALDACRPLSVSVHARAGAGDDDRGAVRSRTSSASSSA